MSATFKLILAHKADSDGLFDVRLRITANRVVRYLNVPGVAIAEKQWNPAPRADNPNWVKSHREAAQYNADLAALLARAQDLRRKQPGLDADGYKQQLQSGADLQPVVVTTPDFLAFAYESHAKDDIGGYSVATCESRKGALNKLAEFWGWNQGKRPLPTADFTESLIADFDAWLKREKGNGPGTRRKSLEVLNIYIGRAIRRKVLPRYGNPLEYYDLPKPTPTKVWITEAELSAFETVRLPPQQHLARVTYFIQYYLHGSRIGVVLRLKWKNRANGAVRFKMDKGEVEKIVEESPQLTALLDSLLPAGEQPDPEAFILPWLFARYEHLSPERALQEMKKATAVVNMNLKRAAIKAGITAKLSSHTSRRALASDADDETHDLGLVQRLLGHTNRATTEKYTRGRDSRVVQAGAQQVYARRPMPITEAGPEEDG